MTDHAHRWAPPTGSEALLAPGGPFELAEEAVLGVPMTVFARRPPHLRAVLEAAVGRQGDLDWLVLPDRRLTYADGAASAARIAAVLSAHGVTKGDRVGFAAANQAAYPLAWWATVAMGAIVSSLNGWWTPAELRHGIELTTPKVILADARRAERLVEAGIPEGTVVLDLADLEPLLGPGDEQLPDVAIDEDDPACILFTSGTTGTPKGATLSHRSFVHGPMVIAMQGAMANLLAPPATPAPRPVLLMVSPMFHVSGAFPLVSSPVLSQQLVLPPPGPWDELTHFRLTAEHRVTAWSGVATHYWRLLEHPQFDEFDTSSVAVLGGGGSVFPPALFRLMASKLPTARLSAGYGMSETLGSGARLAGATLTSHPASVGTVEPLCEIQLRDEQGAPSPDGEVGEICVRGPSAFLGYWDDPTSTGAALDDRRWYRSGDFGRFVGDVLHLESRMRDLILRGGENVYPIEIENRLVEHPAVAEACVVGVPHPHLGQEVAAVVVRHEGEALEPEAVRAWVAEALAPFKVPSYVVFRAELPHTATGKVVKHEVEAAVAAEVATA